MYVGARVFHNLLSYWDFHAQPFLGFTKNGVNKEKYPLYYISFFIFLFMNLQLSQIFFMLCHYGVWSIDLCEKKVFLTLNIRQQHKT